MKVFKILVTILLFLYAGFIFLQINTLYSRADSIKQALLTKDEHPMATKSINEYLDNLYNFSSRGCTLTASLINPMCYLYEKVGGRALGKESYEELFINGGYKIILDSITIAKQKQEELVKKYTKITCEAVQSSTTEYLGEVRHKEDVKKVNPYIFYLNDQDKILLTESAEPIAATKIQYDKKNILYKFNEIDENKAAHNVELSINRTNGDFKINSTAELATYKFRSTTEGKCYTISNARL